MDAIGVKKCIVCENINVRSPIPVCSACRQKDADDLLKAQAFCRENPQASLGTIAEETEVPGKNIKWYIQKGKLGKTQYRKMNAENDNNSLSITETLFGKYIWVQVAGKIDSRNAVALQKCIDRLIDELWTDIIVDMSDVTFLCSTGIRVVLLAYKTLHGLKGSFRIANPSKNVENVMGMVALDTLLL